jgi:hypothetical protein
MNSSAPNAHALYPVRTAAWLLGLPDSEIHRAVRTGALPVVWRSGVCLIPAYALVRLLGAPAYDPARLDRCHGRIGGDAR